MTWQTLLIGAGLLLAARYLTRPLIRFVSTFAEDSGFTRPEVESVPSSDHAADPDTFGTAAVTMGVLAIPVCIFPPATIVLGAGAMVAGFVAERRAREKNSPDRMKRAEVGVALGVFALAWGGILWSVSTALSSG